ncbi:MAG: HAMP domain-containing sensor histidine kinase [Chloroflexota bacterium]
MNKKPISAYRTFFSLILIMGVSAFLWGISSDFQVDQSIILILLILLAIGASYISASITRSSGGAIAYEVGTAISLATVPTLGIGGAMLVVLAATVSINLIRPGKGTNWSISILFFNVAMHLIAIAIAGSALIFFGDWLINDSVLLFFAPWLIAATLYSLVNTILVSTVISLKHQTEISIFEMIKDDAWATILDLFVMWIGGLILDYAIRSNDLIGIIAFFLPILLCAFAFRLYVEKMGEHMNNLESIIEERTQSLKDLMKEKDHFLAVLTHDMKTPLTTINLYSSMLIKRPETLAKKPKIAQAIFDCQKNLSDIVENILDLEKLQVDGEIPVVAENIHLTPIIESLITSLTPQAESKNISISTNLTGLRSLVSAEKGKILRIFQNILSNAIKYTTENGEVLIFASEENDRIAIQIQDTGYGISPEDLPFIFDRFKRVEQHRKLAPGTGLGLAITKALVEAHGGEIEVSSILNVGTSFKVSLPAVPTKVALQEKSADPAYHSPYSN